MHGRLVYNFSTTLDLSAYGSRIPWDGELCAGKLFITMVTFHCDRSDMQSEVMQYDADSCRLLMRTYDPEACSQWLLLLPSAWQVPASEEPWNASSLFSLEEDNGLPIIPQAALPLQPGSSGRARVLIYRILSEAVISKGASTFALPLYIPASYFMRASQAVESSGVSAATDAILVAIYVSTASYDAAVSLHKALHRSSQAFTLLLLCSNNMKKFLQVHSSLFHLPSTIFVIYSHLQVSGDGELSGAIVVDASLGRWAAARSYLTRMTTFGFSHVVLVTPEVDSSSLDIDQLMLYVRDFDVQLAQPAVEHGCPCYSGQMLRRWSVALRWVDIVESQFMVFTRAVWLRMIARVLVPSSPIFWSESNGVELVLRRALDLQRMAVVDAAVVSITCLDMTAALALSPIPVVLDSEGSLIPRLTIQHAVLNAQRQVASSAVVSSMFASTGRAGFQLLGYQAQPWAVPIQPAEYAWRSAVSLSSFSSLKGEKSLWNQLLRTFLKPWRSIPVTPDAVLAAVTSLRDWDPCMQREMKALQRLGLRCIDISGGVLVQLRQGKMHVATIGHPYQSRARSAVHLIWESLIAANSTGHQVLVDVDLVLNTGDHPVTSLQSKLVAAPIFSIATSSSHRDVPWPCFSWWDWPEAGISSWPQQRDTILKAASEWPWKSRVPMLFWRGSDNGKYADGKFVKGKRRPLVQMSRDHSYPAGIIKPGLMEGVLATFTTSRHPLNHVPLADHCRYRCAVLYNFV
jgi:hypothetical protein